MGEFVTDFEYGFESPHVKSPHTQATTLGSIYSGADSKSSSSDNKDKKKKKKKKKSDRSEGSRSKSKRSEKERMLMEQMTAAGGEFSPQDDFGDFGDFDNAEFEDHSAPLDAGSRHSGSRHSGGQASHKTPLTMSTSAGQSNAFTNGASSAKFGMQLDGVMLEFPDCDEDLFHHTNQLDDLEDDEELDDDCSIISELSGLTGVFSSVGLETAANSVVTEEEEQDEYRRMRPTYMAPPTASVAPSLKSRDGPPISRTTSKVPTNRRKGGKSCRFSTISIRHYERILTENPATIKGVSIGIGWRFAEQPDLPLEQYQAGRGPPKPSGSLVIGPDARETLLLDMGYTKKQMAAALRSINKARNQRRQTVQNLKAERVEEAFEGAGKKMRGLFRKKK